VGNEQKKDSDLSVYPNPASDYLTFDRAGYNPCRVELINSTGKTLISATLTIDEITGLSNLPNGVYILRAIYDDEVFTERLVIQN